MSWSLPYTIMPFPIPPPLMIQPHHDTDLPIDLSISGKAKLPTPPPTPDTPSSSSGCQSPRFDSLSFGIISNELERTFNCNDCNYTTRRRTNLKRHIQSMHSRQEIVECCGQNFHSKAEFRAHVKELHQNGYKCQLCSRTFCRKALLKRHMSVHNGIKEFNCKLCNYATSHKSNLERHQRVHNRHHTTSFQDAAAKFHFTARSPTQVTPALITPPSPPSEPHASVDKTPEKITEEEEEEMHIKQEQEHKQEEQEHKQEEQEHKQEEQEHKQEEPEHKQEEQEHKQEEQEQMTRNDRLLALRVATEEVLALQETSKMMAGSQRLCAWPYKCVQCVQRFKTQQALTLHEIQTHPNRRADAFLSFPLKYQLKIVYSAITQAQENSKQD